MGRSVSRRWTWLPRCPGYLKRKVNGMAIDTRETVTTGPSGVAVVQRIIGLAFGLIQLLIVGRIVLLFLDARTTNGIVSGILNLSQMFVAPFEGILRTNSLNASGSVLDVAAVVALIGWTVIELIVISVLAIFGRETA